jgi:hypothetical protein
MIDFDLKKAMNSIPLKKVSKNDIINALDDIMARGVIDSDNAHTLIGLCLCYYFPKPKKAKNNFDWVVNACYTDDDMPTIQNPWVTGDHLHATDGSRLHIVRNKYHEIEKGFRYIDKTHRQLLEIENAEPPNVEYFWKMKKERSLDVKQVKLSDFRYETKESVSIETEIGKIFFDQKYIQETFEMDEIMNVYLGKDVLDCVIFESEDKERICFLMPRRS